MVLKGLLEKLDVGLYKAVEISLDEALARVNVSRVRTGASINLVNPDKTVKEGGLDELPIEIQESYNIARKISQNHGPLVALYFLLYTLLGARKTGFLLLWQGHWFVICEPKTRFCHHYYSTLLANILRSLGLYNGVYYPMGVEHEEAKRIAEEYIHRNYGGYKEARRLHYLLREEGYIGQRDPKPYTLKVYHYEDDSVGVDIYDHTGRELELGINVENKPAFNIETWIALPTMHIDKRNEETYLNE